MKYSTHAVVVLVLEEVIPAWCLVKRHGVGSEMIRRYRAFGDSFQQHRNITVPVLLGRAQGEALVHDGAQGEFVDEATEDPEHEHPSPLASRHNCFACCGRTICLQFQ